MSAVINNYEVINKIFLFVLGGVFGTIFSSFYQLLLDRIPRGESIIGRSHCICKRQLSVFENIPIISYTLLLGKSKCCKSKIPSKHFYGELLSFLIFALISILTNLHTIILALFFWGIIIVLYARKKKIEVS